LPEPQDGVLIVVSGVVALAASDRHDLLVPAEVKRDDDGQTIGCCSLEIIM